MMRSDSTYSPSERAATASQPPTPAVARWRGRRPRTARGYALTVGLAGLLALTVAGCASAAGTTGTPTSATGIGANAAPTVNVPASATDLQQTVVNVISAVEPSVVQVQSSGSSQGGAIGSGEIITSDGYIVTNDHVVTGFSSYSVQLSNGKKMTAQLKGEAPDNDLAVLKISATGLHPIAFGDSSAVKVGQFAIAVGSPLGLAQSATFGIVSALNRDAQEGPGGPAAQLSGLIQTSAPINPGNSGGALVDLQGRLIGIPTLGAVNPESGAAAEGIGFAIPSNTVQTVAQQIIKSGTIAATGHGFLGIQGEDVTPALAAANNLPVQSGVLIAAFGQDASGSSPAQQAGLQVGDIIVQINSTTVNTSSDLTDFLYQQKPGTKVTVTVVRSGGSRTNVQVTLGTRP
ncbi:MAG: trypsin-like peptidase domain-containing protein [Ktedonobacterales bacterium]|nr:trypsin-like peptidase domain-containing protein [Ktedonobacterales bacterium]